MAAVETVDGSARMRTVLITGVSRGCGRAMAVELARRGHTVIGTARSEEKLGSLREQCARLSRQPHLFTTLDVVSDGGVKELARQVVEAGLVPDIVVNNAAAINKNSKLWELPPEEVDIVLDANIKGTINVLRHFIPILIERGHGLVVNMSSLWGRTGAPDVVPYCTSKWAIEGLSRAVAMEVPPEVVVVALDPGTIYTDMLVSCLGSMAMQFPTPEQWAPKAVETILNFTTEDNGASLTVPMDKKTKLILEGILTQIANTKNLAMI